MSDKKKDARFDLSAIRGHEKSAPAPQAAPAPAPDEDHLEQFGSRMQSKTKRRLNQAAARENRKLYELIHDAVTDYLNRHHPDLLD